MTTAHRPTWKAAVGKSNEGGWSAGGAPSARRSALSLPSHTKLKTRKDQEIITKEREEILKKSLQKLREMEGKALGPRIMDEKVEEEGRRKLLMATADVDDEELKKKYDDADDDEEGAGHKNITRDQWSDVEEIINDDSDLDDSDLDDDSDSDEESDDEDEEAALQAELAKIRAEREAAKAKEEAAIAAKEQSEMEEAALIGNPLLNSDLDLGASGKMKRRWNDDVVFRNQARGEPEQKKRFINDTVRNDFHKRFLNKFIR
jgi:Cwf15/Cwc15 cell cycle control protein.